MVSRAVFNVAFARPPAPRVDKWKDKRVVLRGGVPYVCVEGTMPGAPLGRELRVFYAHGNNEDL